VVCGPLVVGDDSAFAVAETLRKTALCNTITVQRDIVLTEYMNTKPK
jgi:hypothetical protein